MFEDMFRKKRINIDKDVYNILSSLSIQKDISLFIEDILFEYIEKLKSETSLKEVLVNPAPITNTNTNNQIEDDLKWLDRILYCSFKIKLAINESMVGMCEYDYELKSYKINAIERSLRLSLLRKDDVFYYDIFDIKGIRSNLNKIWIDTKRTCIRLYCYWSEDCIESLPSTFRSNNILLFEDTLVYEKYRNVDQLRFHVEKFKYDNINSDAIIYTRDFIDKTGVKMTLINITSTNVDDNSGDIITFTSMGREGYFHYSLNRDCLFIHDMQPIRISNGIGSAVIELMVEIALANGKKIIKGNLTPSDFDHKSRLLHFYKKNGFDVYEEELKIVKLLDNI